MNQNERIYKEELDKLEANGNLRRLPEGIHQGKWITAEGRRMLNLSSNDYLGLATDEGLRRAFFNELTPEHTPLSSSSSRLLTGNFPEYSRLEQLLASLFGAESALVFNSGYHMNLGILPAVTDTQTLILADKLVHASIIDGIRLSTARCIRYRHQDYAQVASLLKKHQHDFTRIIIVTESIFSMDGDVAPLPQLVALKKQYPHVMLYVDEAHAIGVRGATGLGIAEEQGCIGDIDFLCGTFGKAIASVGAYVICSRVIREYLVNKMRPLIFSTALPPLNVAWTRFVVERLGGFTDRRSTLARLSARLRTALTGKGYGCCSDSQIVPMVVGSSIDTLLKADALQRKGFYVLAVRPPTVPEGTSRLRFSLTADITEREMNDLIACI